MAATCTEYVVAADRVREFVVFVTDWPAPLTTSHHSVSVPPAVHETSAEVAVTLDEAKAVGALHEGAAGTMI